MSFTVSEPQPIILTIDIEELKEQSLEIISELAKCGGTVIYLRRWRTHRPDN